MVIELLTLVELATAYGLPLIERPAYITIIGEEQILEFKQVEEDQWQQVH